LIHMRSSSLSSRSTRRRQNNERRRNRILSWAPISNLLDQ
jgi:hypothetical protein